MLVLDPATVRGRRSTGSDRSRYCWLPLLLGLILSACASTPPQPVVRQVATAPPPPTEVYFYPTRGQSPAQQDRDRYECYRWAVQQTGFDPSATDLAPHQQLKVVPAPPTGEGAAVGAVTGAIVGGAVASPRHSAEGAVVGAIAGAAIGAASEQAAREEQAERLQRRLDRQEAQRVARVERQARNYRRAMSACLEGRGYSVR